MTARDRSRVDGARRSRAGMVESRARRLRGRGVGIVCLRGVGGRGRGDGWAFGRYPVGLNRHERHILDSTVMPRRPSARSCPGCPRAGPRDRPGPRHGRRANGRVLCDRRGRPARQRDRPPTPQLGTPDDRGRRDATSSSNRSGPSAACLWARPTWSAPPRWSTCWATSGRTANPTGRRRCGSRPRREAPSLRQALARPRSQDGPFDRPRPRSRDGPGPGPDGPPDVAGQGRPEPPPALPEGALFKPVNRHVPSYRKAPGIGRKGCGVVKER